MTEQEWLASEDPERMLSSLDEGLPTASGYDMGHGLGGQKFSDRKLRLWVEACRHVAGVSDYFDIYNAGLRLAIDYWCGTDGRPLSRADRAALLRDIAGNPHRPVTLPQGPKCQVCRGDGAGWTGDNISSPVDWWECDVCGGAGRLPCPWLTPTVLSLAHAAYDERPDAECEECNGYGGFDWYPEDDPSNSRLEGPVWTNCRADCKGGRTTDGRLDHVRLAILADALEEASCNNREILDHLRNNAVHVRGCWVLDLVLGKE